MKTLRVTILMLLLASGCTYKQTGAEKTAVQEIYELEKQFNDYAADHGVREAFLNLVLIVQF